MPATVRPKYVGTVTTGSWDMRKCFRCRRMIGKRGESFHYGGWHPTELKPELHMCRFCHRRCSKSACQYRVPQVTFPNARVGSM